MAIILNDAEYIEYNEHRATAKIVKAKYEELLLAVSARFPGETRHETALRYIRAMEDEMPLYAVDSHGGRRFAIKSRRRSDRPWRAPAIPVLVVASDSPAQSEAA
jgi:hypothetical protein